MMKDTTRQNTPSKKQRTREIHITWKDVLGLSAPHHSKKRKKHKSSGSQTSQTNRTPQSPLSKNVNLRVKRGKKEKKENLYKRLLRFEEMEQRLALSADPVMLSLPEAPDIDFGLVYFEDDMSMGEDQSGDIFHINWNGGAEGTLLSEIRINLDKNENGVRDPGEGFFDITGENGGVYGSYPFELISSSGVGDYDVSVEDGGQLLVIKFTNFEAGGSFVFGIDVDEWGESSDGMPTPNAIFEGGEIDDSLFTYTFVHPDYEIAEQTQRLRDVYQDPALLNLDLPPDDYGQVPGRKIQTAGGTGTFTQIPLPGSISGYVYEDYGRNHIGTEATDNNGIKDANERGIANVQLRLWLWDGSKYVDTGKIATTDTDGYYIFENLDPNTVYRVTEAQPNGYLDGIDTAGSLGGTVSDDSISDIPIGPNEHGTDYNFGELKSGSLSGYVYEDNNDNGIKETDEAGIPGVELMLWVWDGTQYVSTGDTTNTDANGYYIFTDLDPNKTYCVTENQPDGYVDGLDTPGSLGGTATNPGDRIDDIVLGSDQHGTDYNFGEHKYGSLSGYVYEDDDNDGVKDSGEAGIPGVGLTLWVWDGTQYVKTGDTTTTDANGYYIFENLDPNKTYQITETQPDDYSDGLDTPGSLGGTAENPGDNIKEIPLGIGEHGTDYNFGELKFGSLSGYVYEDDDNDGVKDSGEKGIPDVVLTLWVWSGTTYVNTGKVAITDANGAYIFENLDPNKTYQITEIQPDDYSDGLDTPGSLGGAAVNPGDTIKEIPLETGEHGTDYNFGELKYGSLSGYVYEDEDNDGVKDSGEKGIGNVVLTLWVRDGSKYVDTGIKAKTDENGYYLFDKLDPNKTYRITEEQPTGYVDGLDAPGSLGGAAVNPGDTIDGITLGQNQHGTDYNFGELKTGSISGTVYEDYNCDGEYQDSETPIPGVELTLWVWDGTQYVNTGIMETTDENGFYKFDNLDPFKKYRITEKQPEGYYTGKQQVGSLGGETLTPPEKTITEIVVGFDQHGVGYNFAERVPSIISGYVYEDMNDDGVKDPGEVGIKDVEITLYIKNTTTGEYESTGRTVLTDENGYYNFDDLDPCRLYAVREKQPEDFIDGKDTPGEHGGGENGEDDEIIEIDTTPGEESGDNNFGEIRPSSLSGYVFLDGDTVHLYETDPDPTVAPPTWNGTFSENSTRLSGVVLILADANGVPLKDADGNMIQVKTNAEGYYEFTFLKPGTYSVLQEQPEEYLDGIDTPGSHGGTAVNAYDTAKLDELREQGIDVDSMKNDAILGITIRYGEHATRNNFSEVHVVRDLKPVEPRTSEEGPDHPHYTPDPVRSPGGAYPGGGYSYSPSAYLPRHSSEAGGGGIPEPELAWHLSVINGGTPRGDEMVNAYQYQQPGSQYASQYSESDANPYQKAVRSQGKFKQISWRPLNKFNAKWIIRGKLGTAIEMFSFGDFGSQPIVGDFNGDGISEIGVYHEGYWYIDLNGNGVWDEGDMIIQLGTVSDQPVAGDWDGDGKCDIGIFGRTWAGDDRALKHEPGLPTDLNTKIATRPKNVPPRVDQAPDGERILQRTAQGTPRLDLIDHVFAYGEEGDIAFAGDFTGDGIANIGVYRKGSFYIDIDGDGKWDESVDLLIENVGREGEIPVIGNFKGDEKANIGLYKDGYWRLDTTGNYKLDTEIRFGEPGDLPVVGDFNGDGYSQLGLFRQEFDDSPTTFSASRQQNPGDFPTLATPARQYADQFSAESQQIETQPIEMQTETVQGGLPDEISTRPERTIRSPQF